MITEGQRTMSQRERRRVSSLYDFLDREYGMQESSVTLPISGREYRVLRPAQETIDHLFATAPVHLQPFWTRIWPSGVALADVVLSRASELRDRQVLELGSGLGVTAAATTQAGATVIAADFSAAALAYCRLNTLVNAQDGPRTLPPLDWRNPSRQASVRLDAYGQFSVVLAADVLYESGDIGPLMHLIDRVLTPDGALWLAEPGRATAQRFLYRMAADGWHGDSMSIEVPEENGSTQNVNVHILRRPSSLDWLRSSLGGWRV